MQGKAITENTLTETLTRFLADESRRQIQRRDAICVHCIDFRLVRQQKRHDVGAAAGWSVDSWLFYLVGQAGQ